MDCSTFRDRHLMFADFALDEREIVAMETHLAECEGCRRHDTAVRRGMLLCRNLPEIAPSADFQARLQARLRDVKVAAREAALAHAAGARRAPLRTPGLGLFAASVVGVVAAGWVAAVSIDRARPTDLVLPPAVALATPPAPDPEPPSPAVLASVSVGMPVWPAAAAVEAMQANFESAGFVLASYTR